MAPKAGVLWERFFSADATFTAAADNGNAGETVRQGKFLCEEEDATGRKFGVGGRDGSNN